LIHHDRRDKLTREFDPQLRKLGYLSGAGKRRQRQIIQRIARANAAQAGAVAGDVTFRQKRGAT
jgi:hypothetical protein